MNLLDEMQAAADTVARPRIEAALEEHRGNLTAAARSLGVTRYLLRGLIRRLGLQVSTQTRAKSRDAAVLRAVERAGGRATLAEIGRSMQVTRQRVGQIVGRLLEGGALVRAEDGRGVLLASEAQR